jgi:hypothetical protein
MPCGPPQPNGAFNAHRKTLDTWQFPLELEPATLTVGGKFLRQLEAGLRGIPKGEGDFGIGLSPPLYFWWCRVPPNISFKADGFAAAQLQR